MTDIQYIKSSLPTSNETKIWQLSIYFIHLYGY